MSETTDKLITIKPFSVWVRANEYSGKYYTIGAVPVRVMADSADQAIAYVNSHKEEVLAHIDKKRLQNGKKLVKSPVEKNVFFEPMYRVKETEITLMSNRISDVTLDARSQKETTPVSENTYVTEIAKMMGEADEHAAANEFMASVYRAGKLAKKLQKAIADHYDFPADDIDYSHVGTSKKVEKELEDILKKTLGF